MEEHKSTPNIRYAEYIHAGTHENKNGNEFHKNLLINEDVGARVLEYILTQQKPYHKVTLQPTKN